MMIVRAKKVENSSNEQCRHHRDGFIATIYLELFNASVELLFNHGIKLNKNTKAYDLARMEKYLVNLEKWPVKTMK